MCQSKFTSIICTWSCPYLWCCTINENLVLYFAIREADELWIYEIWLSGELDGLRQLSDFLCFNSHYKGEDDDLNLNLCGGGKFPNTHREKLDNYKEEHDNPPEQREDIMDIGKHNQKWK